MMFFTTIFLRHITAKDKKIKNTKSESKKAMDTAIKNFSNHNANKWFDNYYKI